MCKKWLDPEADVELHIELQKGMNMTEKNTYRHMMIYNINIYEWIVCKYSNIYRNINISKYTYW